MQSATGNTVKPIIKPVKRDISYFKVVCGKCVVVPLLKSCQTCAYQAHHNFSSNFFMSLTLAIVYG